MNLRRIAVVDDEAEITEMTSSLLELLGYQVVAQGRDGREAVDIFNRDQPDLIFLDYNMPKMNGLNAALEIKANFPNAKIGICSGYLNKVAGDESSPNLMELEKLGIKFLQKPFSVTQLQEFVESYFESEERKAA
ncbi:MAG: response regulator [Verrucomicrobiota bacterium]|nr:response regulator [Verrucomicrobiota bacterium]